MQNDKLMTCDLKIKKLHPDAIIPQYTTKGAVAFDLHALEDTDIWEFRPPTFVRTGLAVEIPEGFEMQVRQRSGLSIKWPNYIVICVGTIDQDYRGEIMVPIRTDKKAWNIKRGDRIAQAVISPVTIANIIEVDELSDTDRGSGGFGHTGK